MSNFVLLCEEEDGRLLAMGLDFTSLKVTIYSREGC